jgi:CopG family nickel-responsive transcriptional regulator
MQRITLSVDDELVAALDRHMKTRRYASRSEALRDILRQHQARESLQPAHGGS